MHRSTLWLLPVLVGLSACAPHAIEDGNGDASARHVEVISHYQVGEQRHYLSLRVLDTEAGVDVRTAEIPRDEFLTHCDAPPDEVLRRVGERSPDKSNANLTQPRGATAVLGLGQDDRLRRAVALLCSEPT